MMVISLGRLGMREFDLASDADLIFVIPDEDAAEEVFWTAVAERMINVISAYTGDGAMFTVDTRLRPNGREGALVLPECAYRDYFEKHAEAWEGIAYMKSRAVAGNSERATNFLHRLQEMDWRRYGQSGTVAQGTGANAHPPGKRAGRPQSAESRGRRILRYRFRPDVPAAERRRASSTRC